MNARRPAIALALALALTNSSGCMGSFTLTKKLYDFNNTITGNKIINNLVFWALLILPVYSISFFLDGAILNLIEFWTGSNPLALNDVEKLEDGSLRVVRNGDVLEARPLDATHVQVSRNGTVIGVLEVAADGALVVRDATGAEATAIPVDEQEAMAPVLAGLGR